jgi:hypothetical protein
MSVSVFVEDDVVVETKGEDVVQKKRMLKGEGGGSTK